MPRLFAHACRRNLSQFRLTQRLAMSRFRASVRSFTRSYFAPMLALTWKVYRPVFTTLRSCLCRYCPFQGRADCSASAGWTSLTNPISNDVRKSSGRTPTANGGPFAPPSSLTRDAKGPTHLFFSLFQRCQNFCVLPSAAQAVGNGTATNRSGIEIERVCCESK